MLESCGTKEVTETLFTPSLTVSTTVITATSDEGNYSFTYSVRNPAEDGRVTCGADADWICDLSWFDDGTVSFTASENPEVNSRMAQISVSYNSSYGTIAKIVTVAQNSSQTPEITISPTGIGADIDGGTYSFNYTIKNPLPDGQIDFSANVSWISELTEEDEGTVSFSVNGNTEAEIREGIITVSYFYGTDAASETLTVVQDGYDLSGVSELEGTYKCTGIVYNHSWDQTSATEPGVEATWTLKIFDNGNGTVTLSGLVPDIADYYPDQTSAYIAVGSVSGHNITIYPQFTGYYNTAVNGYLCWALCRYYSNEDAYSGFSPGWYIGSVSYMPITFAYYSATDSWVTDTYGMALGNASIYNDISTFFSFKDIFAPGMSFTKISSHTTSVSDSSADDFEAMPAYTSFMPYIPGK